MKKEFDYIAEADAVCSPHFNPEQVNLFDFNADLRQIIDAANRINIHKKLLFRGKSRSDLGFREHHPEEPKLSERVELADADITHGIVGAITEVGELAELLQKYLYREAPLDRVNAIEEAGDIMWYLSRILKWGNTDFASAMRLNIDKLHGRHGETFNVARDWNRDLSAERAKLEAGTPLFARMEEKPCIDDAVVQDRLRDLYEGGYGGAPRVDRP